MSGVIIIKNGFNQAQADLAKQVLQQAAISCNIRIQQEAIIVNGTNDEIIKAKELLNQNGFELI
ncbi:MAG: hypothetical protein HFE67_01875 [Erysipelotrichaceae bacterium]|nr:hypothetical protein [Erysipelotrichaceae bacterium]